MEFQGPNTFCVKEVQVRNREHSFTNQSMQWQNFCLHEYGLASHSHTVVWHLPVVPKQLLLSSARNTARGWYIFKRDFLLPPLFQEGFLHRSVASSHKYWCENDWEGLLWIGNKKPRAVGRVRAAFTGAATGITYWSLIVWDWQSETMLFLGLDDSTYRQTKSSFKP